MQSIRIFLVLVTTLVGACETGTIRDTTVIPAGTSVVFGDAEAFVDGEKKEWGKMRWSGTDSIDFLILPPNTNKALIYRLSDEGGFFWNLEPGQYVVLGYRLYGDAHAPSGRLWYSFEVPQEPQNLYLGKIRIDIRGNRYKSQVQDDFNAMLAVFEKRYPDAERPTKKLFSAEETLGNYSHLKPICLEDWGIQCTSRYRGIEPISPEFTIDGFLFTTSLMPTFDWKPSANPKVSYDLAIYEAASYTGTLIHDNYTPGRLAVYEEDIKGSHFTPKEPLKPGTKYFWSVRLRDGDVVSDWSTFGYAVFVVVYASSGRGLWFGFSTP